MFFSLLAWKKPGEQQIPYYYFLNWGELFFIFSIKKWMHKTWFKKTGVLSLLLSIEFKKQFFLHWNFDKKIFLLEKLIYNFFHLFHSFMLYSYGTSVQPKRGFFISVETEILPKHILPFRLKPNRNRKGLSKYEFWIY